MFRMRMRMKMEVGMRVVCERFLVFQGTFFFFFSIRIDRGGEDYKQKCCFSKGMFNFYSFFLL